MNQSTYEFSGVVTALSSISHIGGNKGITSLLRREKVVTPDGVEEIPIISGNGMRGLLRDLGMMHMLKLLGYALDEESEHYGISLASFYFLFSGGALTSTGDRGIDIDEARRWRDLIPLVALFGGAMGNQIMPGKLAIGKLIPICQETAHLLPERVTADHAPLSVWDMVQQEAYTRKDDEKNENIRWLLTDSAKGQLQLSATKKKAKKDDMVEETGQKQQMRYFVETLAAGTRFYWKINLHDVSPVEFDAFAVNLAEFSRRPYIGGKSGVGHGEVSIKFDEWLELDPRVKAGKEVGLPLGQYYLNHLQGKQKEIRGLIDGLS